MTFCARTSATGSVPQGPGGRPVAGGRGSGRRLRFLRAGLALGVMVVLHVVLVTVNISKVLAAT